MMIPPEFIPIPAAVILDQSRSQLLGYYARLRLLAWSHDFQETDPLDISQLGAFLNLKRRQFYNVLQELKDIGWISTSIPKSGFIRIKFTRLEPVQNIALEEVVVVNTVVKLNRRNNNKQRGDSAINCTPGDFSAINCTDLARARLIEMTVHPNLAETLLSEAEPGAILEYCEIYDWAIQRGIAKGVGYLIRSIQNNWRPPFGYAPPGWRCVECGYALPKHEKGCRKSYIPLEEMEDYRDTCQTCGQFETHSAECWRQSIHS